MKHPTSTADITPAFLSNAIGKTVEKVNVAAAHDAPHLGAVWRISTENDSYIIKAGASLGAQGEGARLFARKLNLGRREVYFYGQLASLLVDKHAFLPKIYLCLDDEERGEVQTLVMEDLTQRGWVSGNIALGCSEERLLSVMKLLGKMHHSFWGKLEDAHPLLWDMNGKACQAFFLDEFEMLYQRLGSSLSLKNALEEGEWEMYGKVKGLAKSFLDDCMKGPFSLAMGDTRLDNIFFKGEDAKGLIDWQFCMRGGALGVATDVAAFLCLNAETKDCENVGWNVLLDAYYDGLDVEDISREECYRLIREACIWPIGLMIQSGGRSVVEKETAFTKEAQRLFLIGRGRAWKAVVGMGALEVLHGVE